MYFSPSVLTLPTHPQHDDYTMSHAVYSHEEVTNLNVTSHFPPAGWKDRAALGLINVVRRTFDLVTGYDATPGKMNADKFLTRAIFLETVAAVPGMVGAIVRHFESLRLMRRDGGWIHTLLSEAENERMHLLTFLELKTPVPLMRAAVLVTQGVFFNLFFLMYIVSPSACHRFVGYLEEEACRTYTHLLRDIDAGLMPEWNGVAAPPIAVKYWRLGEDATLRDVILAIRADEAIHRDVSHVFANLKPTDPNPFV